MSYAGGLLNCCGDWSVFIYVYFCPWLAHAENIAMINEESCGICHIINCYSEYYIRRNISKKLGEPVSDCNDCLSNCCCFPCLVCQNQRALLNDTHKSNKNQTETI